MTTKIIRRKHSKEVLRSTLGGTSIKNNNKNTQQTSFLGRTLLCLTICSVLLLSEAPSLEAQDHSSTAPASPVSLISQEIELEPYAEYIIHYSPDNFSLLPDQTEPYSEGLSPIVHSAVAKAPTWIQRDLIRQMKTLENPDDYAHLLITAPKHYVDELAFSIACSPVGDVASPATLWNNVHTLYELDKDLPYADILDYAMNSSEYYSTVRHKILRNGSEDVDEYPSDIYYWYIVHPEIGGGHADTLDGASWRDYLYYHNDLGYPLLQECMDSIQYLWDSYSYTQPAQRLWQWSMELHPTAMEVASYWIGKTVPFGAIGDRPVQAQIIAHEHNGWCGELARLAVAVQRTLLIPSQGVFNSAEDHVWREFYDQDWHQSDNWWTDSGGSIDTPDVYTYGWGKDMSAIYALRGDDTIYDVTQRYMHPEDYITVSFNVTSWFDTPLDGVRIIVLVQGLKDITWIKNTLKDQLTLLWEKLPSLLKGPLMSRFYTYLNQKLDNMSDVIDGLTISTWNYTDGYGRCSFHLGKNHDYFFLLQEGMSSNPLGLPHFSTVKRLSDPEDITYHISLPVPSKRLKHTPMSIPEGDCRLNLSFTTEGYQIQSNIKNKNTGIYTMPGDIECFIVDGENLENHKNGKAFSSLFFTRAEEEQISLNISDSEWYIILRNPHHTTNHLVEYTIALETVATVEKVAIVTPNTTLFDYPTADIGDILSLTGIATDTLHLTINDQEIVITPTNNQWSHSWNTTGYPPGLYTITAATSQARDTKTIRLVDACPPQLQIDQPREHDIVEESIMLISGRCSDNYMVSTVELACDRGPFYPVQGVEQWQYSLDTASLSAGDHLLTVRAIDGEGLSTLHQLSFVLNASISEDLLPQVQTMKHVPEEPRNMSMIWIYANVTCKGPFALDMVEIYNSDDRGVFHSPMYSYANHPIQSRHEEDPLRNESNEPVFGFMLGEYPTNQTITYWIVARDTGGHTTTSAKQTIVVH